MTQRACSILAFTAALAVLACSDAGVDGAPSRAGAHLASAHAGADAAASAPVAGAASRFLAKLDDRQRSAATFAFDDPARTAWSYVPQARTGIALKELDAGQRAAAFDLLGSALSPQGTGLARGIVDLEITLQSLERAAGNAMASRRDAGLYYLATYGAPDESRPWGWRFEGHHLSVNVTQLGQRTQIVAPLFMGANPARVPGGPQAGLRLLAAEQDLAFDLLHMLDPPQRARAVIGAATFGDIVTRNDPVARPLALSGLPAAAMTPAQQQQLRRLLEHYAGRMADRAASRQLQRIDAAGFERLHFAWAGAQHPREPHYYRIHGPTVLVEFDNTQNGADHIHTVWRDLENDFGGDLLRRHYADPSAGEAGHGPD